MCGGLAGRLALMYILVYYREKRLEKKWKKFKGNRIIFRIKMSYGDRAACVTAQELQNSLSYWSNIWVQVSQWYTEVCWHQPEEYRCPVYGMGLQQWGYLPHMCRSDLWRSEPEAALWLCSENKVKPQNQPPKSINGNHMTGMTETITVRMWFKVTLSKSTGRASSQGQWRLLHQFIISMSRRDKFSCVQDRYIINNGCLPIKLKDGWKYPPATETDYIVQNVNAAFTFDKLHSVFNITSGGCSRAFLTAAIQPCLD